ncbi:MAG: DUF4442 domain-containing protein [Proteobacteria bacterium]|nr:DUF4442 domain-containing protein [Pseudomonadota bacterium]
MVLRLPAWLVRLRINWWGPYRGAGIRVTAIAPDWREVRVELVARRGNRNAFGTHFGGSLYAMTDPFYVLMLSHALGPGYRVWDQRAEIDFLRPGRGTVRAEFRLEAAEVERVRAAVAGGDKLLPEYTVEVRDAAGEVVAHVRKRLYVRRARDAAPPAHAA